MYSRPVLPALPNWETDPNFTGGVTRAQIVQKTLSIQQLPLSFVDEKANLMILIGVPIYGASSLRYLQPQLKTPRVVQATASRALEDLDCGT